MSVCVVVKLIVIVVGVNNVFESKDTVPLANESHNRNNHPKQTRRMHIQGPHDRDNADPTRSITDLYGRVSLGVIFQSTLKPVSNHDFTNID